MSKNKALVVLPVVLVILIVLLVINAFIGSENASVNSLVSSLSEGEREPISENDSIETINATEVVTEVKKEVITEVTTQVTTQVTTEAVLANNTNADILKTIQSEADLEQLATVSNAYVKMVGDGFYVAVLCFDENNMPCIPQSYNTVVAEYSFYHFINGTVNIYSRTYDARISETGAYGVCEWNGEWYEVYDGFDGETHAYGIKPLTQEGGLKWIYDITTDAHLRSNTQFFLDHGGKYLDATEYALEIEHMNEKYAADQINRIMVGEMKSPWYGKILDISQVKSRRDMDELVKQEDVISIKLDEDAYVVILPWNEWGKYVIGYRGIEELHLGFFRFDGEEAVEIIRSVKPAEDSWYENLGVGEYNAEYYLIGKEDGTDKYGIEALSSELIKNAGAEDELITSILNNAIFFGKIQDFDDPYKGSKKVWNCIGPGVYELDLKH